MGKISELIWYLKFRISVLTRQVEAYQNGNEFCALRAKYEGLCSEKDVEIHDLKKKLGKAHAETITVRKYWEEVMDDVYAETHKLILIEQKKTKEMEERALRAESQRDEAKDKETQWRHNYYELSGKLEEAEALNRKLTAQVNKDFENSSTPSSKQGPGRKKIPNSREKTGRKRGGQPGHKGHRLTPLKATETHEIPDPEKFSNNSDYYATEEYVRRQQIGITIDVQAIEYSARVYRDRITGSRVHADFPEGFDTDVCYDSSVKALAFLLINECDVSAVKAGKLISELTGKKINMSAATINGLSREFAAKSKPEKDYIIEGLMKSPVMNADFTNSNVNGEGKQVLILASPTENLALYISRDSKGHKGVMETPLEQYVGTVVHDHDATFYSYGLRHQECMQHNIRYLKGSIENEPERKWNNKMLILLREMIHYRNNLPDGTEPDLTIVKKLEGRYDRILRGGMKEYEDEPPGRYYREGYNLCRRLIKYKESELLFLHDMSVPSNNSLAERLARVYKRKQKQAIVFRSDERLADLCDCLSHLFFLRVDNEDMYKRVSEIFARPMPREATA